MKDRFRLTKRSGRGGRFYCVDTETKSRVSLGTSDEDAARQIVQAKNQALRQPALNLQIAKAYLAGSDSGTNTRTWNDALNSIIESKKHANQHRWKNAAKDKAFDLIRNQIIVETKAESLLKVRTRVASRCFAVRPRQLARGGCRLGAPRDQFFSDESAVENATASDDFIREGGGGDSPAPAAEGTVVSISPDRKREGSGQRISTKVSWLGD